MPNVKSGFPTKQKTKGKIATEWLNSAEQGSLMDNVFIPSVAGFYSGRVCQSSLCLKLMFTHFMCLVSVIK